MAHSAVRKILSSLFATVLFCAGAHAQVGFGGMFPGPGTPHSAGGVSNIAFDNSYDPGSNGGSGNISTAYTGASLSDGLLVACIAGDTTTDSVTAVSYNAVAMTQGQKFQNPQAGGRWIYLYYLLNPASGSHTFAVTQSGGGFLIPVLGEYSGVKQSGQPDATATNSSILGSFSTNITIANTNAWAIACAQTGTPGSFTSGTGGTFRLKDATFGNIALYDSNAGASAGVYSFGVNMSANVGINIVSFQSD